MPGNFISGFKLEIQWPLAKMPWKYGSHYGWPTKKILVFWTVIHVKKCLEKRFALSALLLVFHCIISLLIAFHFIVLLIAFSKYLLKNNFFKKIMFRTNRFITIQNWPPKTFCLFFSYPRPKCTPSSNRLNTSNKLTIIFSVTKDVYIRLCISLIRYHMQI